MKKKDGQGVDIEAAIKKAAELELLEYFSGTEVEGLMKYQARFLAAHIAQRTLDLFPSES